MFFDSSILGAFIVDRVSGAGKTLRRVVTVHAEGSLVFSKPNGVICRIVPLGHVTHLVTAADAVNNEDDPKAWVLMRVMNEHDLLFRHVPGASGVATMRHHAMLSTSTAPIGVQFANVVLEERSKLRATPLQVAAKSTPQILREAADVARRADFVKPRSFAVSNQVLIPRAFDDLNLSQSATGPRAATVSEASIAVEPSFLLMLQRSVRLHPAAASAPPHVLVDCGEDLPAIQVSSSFLVSFCEAYDAAMPHTVHLQTHLPRLTTFRASKRFWSFMQSALRVTRPPNTLMAMLGTSHVVGHCDDDESSAVAATLSEWNDAVIAWEADTRGRQDNDAAAPGGAMSDASGAGGGANGRFWQSFVEELSMLSAAQNPDASKRSLYL